MKILIPSSAGDLIDRITILKVKKLYIKDKDKLVNVEAHLRELRKVEKKLPRSATLVKLTKELLALNKRQWVLEDRARLHWKKKDYKGVAKAAHAVHLSNDKRGVLKRGIDAATGSRLVDEKQYAS